MALCPETSLGCRRPHPSGWARRVASIRSRQRSAASPTTFTERPGLPGRSILSSLGMMMDTDTPTPAPTATPAPELTDTPAPELTRAAARPQRGDELELTIDSLAYGGAGVARTDGYVVFVSGAVPGD